MGDVPERTAAGLAQEPRGRPWPLLALLLVPVLLFAPMILAGRLFLPFLPVSLSPLAEEYPEAAAAARIGQQPVLGDRVYPFLSDQLALREEVLAGNAPTWDPDLGLGMPLFGGTVAGPAYPPNALAVALPPERAAAPLAALSLVLAGAGLWLFLRRVGLSPPAALMGALAFQLGTWGVANLFYPMKVDAALWFPWLLYGLAGLRSGRRGSGAVVSLALACSFLAGMVTVAAFVAAAGGLYALWTSAFEPRELALREERRSVPGTFLRAMLFLALGPALAALYLLPLAATGRASLRSASSPEQLVQQSLATTTLLGLVLPDPVGRPTEPGASSNLPLAWWMTPASEGQRAENANVLEWNTHAGVLVVLLAAVAAVASTRRALFPCLLLLGVLGFAQGWPGVRWLYHVPGLGLGAPGRVLGLAWCLWPWLAALGAQALLDHAPRARATFLITALGLSGLALYAWVDHEPSGFGPALVERMVARYGDVGVTADQVNARLSPHSMRAAADHLEQSFARLSAAALAALLSGLLLYLRFDLKEPRRLVRALGLALLVALTLSPLFLPEGEHGSRVPLALAALVTAALVTAAARWMRGQPVQRPGWTLALLFVPLCAEGWFGTYGHVHARVDELGRLFPPSAGVEALRDATAGGRLLRFDASPDGLSQAAQLARPNLLAPYRIGDLTPYPSFTPREPVELLRRLDPRFTQRNHVAPLRAPGLLGHPVLDLVRASAILSAVPLEHGALEPVLEGPGFHLYRRPSALGPARVVPRALSAATEEAGLEALASGLVSFADTTLVRAADFDRLQAPGHDVPGFEPGALEVTRPRRNALRVDVRDSDGGFLVVHEQWAEGWRATVNGVPVPLFRADHLYRGLVLPPGDSTVLLEYAPPSLARGLWLSACAALVLLALELFSLRRRS